MVISSAELRKIRCENGADGTLLRIKDFTAEDIIINSYLHTDSDIAMQLAKKYEYMLVLAKLNPKKYKQQRDKLFSEFAKWIHTNKLYSEWVDFVRFVHINSHDHNFIIQSAYMSEMMESWAYLTGHNGTLINGLTSEGEPIIAPDYYGDWDRELHQLHKDFSSAHKNASKAEKLLFYEQTYDQFFSMERNENLLHISVFGMIPFVNERTQSIIPKKPYPLAEANGLRFPRIWKDTEFYKQELKKRKFIINSKGADLLLKNAGSWTRLLLLEDVTKDGKVIMLFQLSNPDGATYGYYSLDDGFFHTCYRYSDGRELHERMENLVLEIYTEVVCGLEKDRKRIYAIQEVEDIDHTEEYKGTHLFIQFNLRSGGESTGKRGARKGSHQKSHERKHARRKLPENWVASEEAIKRAQEIGLALPEGYTYVRKYKAGGVNAIRERI